MINANELKIGDKIRNEWEAKWVYKVAGFDNTYGPKDAPKHGVRIVRWIKSRNDWGTTPQAHFCKEDGELNRWHYV